MTIQRVKDGFNSNDTMEPLYNCIDVFYTNSFGYPNSVHNRNYAMFTVLIPQVGMGA